MKNKIRGSVSLLIGFVLLGIIGWGIIVIARLFWKSIISLEPALASAIIAASATVLVAVATVVIGKYFERNREIENQRREKKIEVYEEFMEKWFDKLLDVSKSKSQGKNPLDDTKFIQFLTEFTRKLILWGSDSVVKKYASFRKESIHPVDDSPYTTLYNFEQVLFEIRKDIGHSNQALKVGDLLTLFINDLPGTVNKAKN